MPHTFPSSGGWQRGLHKNGMNTRERAHRARIAGERGLGLLQVPQLAAVDMTS